MENVWRNFCYETIRFPSIRIALANIVTAFENKTIGSKAIDQDKFMLSAAYAIENVDWSTCREVGQAYIPLPQEACGFVSAGIGKRTDDPTDYIIRAHRGQIGIYLKRYSGRHIHANKDGNLIFDDRGDSLGFPICIYEFYFGYDPKAVCLAAPVDNVAVVVYTKEAYLKDPDCTEEEHERINSLGCTHVLVAVLASSGKPSPLTPHRFIHNLAGGNREALLWTADEIRAKAKEIKKFSSEWCVVAD